MENKQMKKSSMIHDVMNKLTIALAVAHKVDGSCNHCDKADINKLFNSLDAIRDIMKAHRATCTVDVINTGDAIDMVEVWKDSVSLLYDNVDVELDIPRNINRDQLIKLKGQLMDLVFSNVIENSVKFGATKLKFSIRQKEFFTEIRLTDNGSGMTQDQLDAIGFGYTNGGSGVGTLYVRRHLMNMHGKALWESEVGKGTTFIARLRNVRCANEDTTLIAA